MSYQIPRARILLATTILAVAVLGGAAIRASAQTTTPTAPNASGAWVVDAARTGDTAAAGVFIAHCADVDEGRAGDGTALIVAARNGDMAMARLLVEQGAGVDRPMRGDGNPLIAAAAHGRIEMVDYLIAQGARVNAVVPDDETALINAARAGHLDVVRRLVSAGADVDLTVPVTLASGATELRSPVNQARRNHHSAVVAYLIQQGARR